MEISRIQPIKVGDRYFEVMIPYHEIMARIDALAGRINADYADRESIPVLVGVLNGAFMFCAELARRLTFDCEVSFVKFSSYDGVASSGTVTELIGLKEDVRGRDVIIVEDIVETGTSISRLTESLSLLAPASVNVACMLFKPSSYMGTAEIRYPAMEIPDDFIIGFGLDYNGLGRNLKDIYKIIDERR